MEAVWPRADRQGAACVQSAARASDPAHRGTKGRKRIGARYEPPRSRAPVAGRQNPRRQPGSPRWLRRRCRRCLERQPRRGIGNGREPRGPIEATTSQQPHAPVFDPHMQPVPVPFDLVQPTVTSRHVGGEGSEAGLDELRKGIGPITLGERSGWESFSGAPLRGTCGAWGRRTRPLRAGRLGNLRHARVERRALPPRSCPCETRHHDESRKTKAVR